MPGLADLLKKAQAEQRTPDAPVESPTVAAPAPTKTGPATAKKGGLAGLLENARAWTPQEIERATRPPIENRPDPTVSNNAIVSKITGGKKVGSFISDIFDSLGEGSRQVSSAIIDTPAEWLSDTKFIKDWAQAGQGDKAATTEGFAANTFESILNKLSAFGSGALTGVTGGAYEAPETAFTEEKDLVTKTVGALGQGLGMVYTIGGLTRAAAPVTSAPGIAGLLSKYPKVAKYAIPLIQNAVAFNIYGQLDPKLGADLGRRAEKFLIDTATAPLYTLLGRIKSPAISLPASFGLGFGMAKMGGASDEDALASGIAFAILDGAMRATHKPEFATGRKVEEALKSEALDVLSKYSGEKLTGASTPEQIKAAWRKAAFNTHPDRGGKAEDFVAMQSAYEFLSGKGTLVKPGNQKPGTEAMKLDSKQLQEIRAHIKHSEGLDIAKAIKAGDLKATDVYVNGKSGELTPEFAAGRINDVAQKLDAYRPGLGEAYRDTVQGAVTMKDIIQRGLTFYDGNVIARGQAKDVYRYEGGEKGKLYQEFKDIAGEGAATVGKGKYFSLDNKSSSDFGDILKTFKLPNDLKLYDATKGAKSDTSGLSGLGNDPVYRKGLIESKGDMMAQAKKQGYDGIIFFADDGVGKWLAIDPDIKLPETALAPVAAPPTPKAPETVPAFAPTPTPGARPEAPAAPAATPTSKQEIQAHNLEMARQKLAEGATPLEVTYELSQYTSTDNAEAIVAQAQATPAAAPEAPVAPQVPQEAPTAPVERTAREPRPTEEKPTVKALSEAITDSVLERTPADFQEEFVRAQEEQEAATRELKEEIRTLENAQRRAPAQSKEKAEAKLKVKNAKEALREAEEEFSSRVTGNARGFREYLRTRLNDELQLGLSKEDAEAVIDEITTYITEPEQVRRAASRPLSSIIEEVVGGKVGLTVYRESERRAASRPKADDLMTRPEVAAKLRKEGFTPKQITEAFGKATKHGNQLSLKEVRKAAGKPAQVKKPEKPANKPQKEGKKPLAQPTKQVKTQKEKVAEVVKAKGDASIKDVARETKIVEPTIRRILGVGAKTGEFERVGKGVYRVKVGDNDVAVIFPGDALEILPQLVKDGFKSDMVFLDIPYNTPAVKGGNRGVKYDLISVEQFGQVLDNVKDILKDKDAPLIHMFSNAESGKKKMAEYNELLITKGFIPVARGSYTKMAKNGQVFGFPTPQGHRPLAAEGIIILNQSGKEIDVPKDMDFKLVRPDGYQTEKPKELLKALIEMTTAPGDMVLDPFAGSGVTLEQAVAQGRRAVGIEKKEGQAAKIAERVEKAKPADTPKQTKLKKKEANSAAVAEAPTRAMAEEYLAGVKRRLGIDFDTVFVDRILAGHKVDVFKKLKTDIEAEGAMTDNTIALAREFSKYAPHHEVGHLVFKNLESMPIFARNGITRDKLLEAQAKKMGVAFEGATDKTKGDLEEQMMLDFEKWMDGKEAAKGFLLKFFTMIKSKLLGLMRAIKATKGDILDDFYRIIADGKEVSNRVRRLENQGVVQSFVREGVLNADRMEAALRDKVVLDSLTTNILSKLGDRTTVSKQFVTDLTKSPDVKKPERELITATLETYPDTINVKDFKEDVAGQLLQLDAQDLDYGRYDNVVLPDGLRGYFDEYHERIYQSPVETKAGGAHFSGKKTKDGNAIDRYFAHVRSEDIADYDSANIRRIIEIQSDLFQRGSLELETQQSRIATEKKIIENAESRLENLKEDMRDAEANGSPDSFKETIAEQTKTQEERLARAKEALALLEKGTPEREKELAKLAIYRNTWWERVIREERRLAAQDEFGKLRFPTGETALKIEGLMGAGSVPEDAVQGTTFEYGGEDYTVLERYGNGDVEVVPDSAIERKFSYAQARDEEIANEASNLEEYLNDPSEYDSRLEPWLKSGEYELLKADGKDAFLEKYPDAIQEAAERMIDDRHTNAEDFADYWKDETGENYYGAEDTIYLLDEGAHTEQMSASGKQEVDVENPIYKFYENDVAKYLKNRYGAQRITDDRGVEWMEIDVPADAASQPITAFKLADEPNGAKRTEETKFNAALAKESALANKMAEWRATAIEKGASEDEIRDYLIRKERLSQTEKQLSTIKDDILKVDPKDVGAMRDIGRRLNLYRDTLAAQQKEFDANFTMPKTGVPIVNQETVAPAPKPAEPKPDTEIRKSRAFERVLDRLTDELAGQASASYEVTNMADEVAKALQFVDEFPAQARRVALGIEPPPYGLVDTETAISIAYAEKMLEQGNYQAVADAERSRSLRQTQRGKEISMERGRVANSPQAFIQEVVKARMELAGKKLFAGLADVKRSEKQSYASKAADRIKKEAETLKKVVNSKKVDAAEAQKILDSIVC